MEINNIKVFWKFQGIWKFNKLLENESLEDKTAYIVVFKICVGGKQTKEN